MTSSIGSPVPGVSTSWPCSTNVPGVAEVVDVLPRRALARCGGAGDGVGAGRVERDRVALEDLGEVGADVVEVDLVAVAVAERRRRRLLDEHEHVALEDGVAGRDGQLREPPARPAR